MRVLTTVLKQTEGMVSLDGILYNERNYEKIQKKIGYLPQEIDLYPNLTVKEWKILMNREDSEECVNDTWFAAWRYIPPKRPPRLVAFLGKITRGFAIDMLRKKYAVKRMDMHIVEITEEVESLNTATMYNLDEHMEAEKLIEIINDFLKSLSDRDRDIFVQRYWVMESIKNIATRHKMSEGAIKQNLLRNKRKLKKILEREGRL